MSNSDGIAQVDALDLYATVKSHGVSIHMDGDRDAELVVEGPDDGGEVHDGKVYRFTLCGDQAGVRSDVSFFIAADDMEQLVQPGTDQEGDNAD